MVFVSSLYDSLISGHILAELFMTIAKYFPFLQMHALGLKKILSFSHIWCFLQLHWHLLLFHLWSKVFFYIKFTSTFALDMLYKCFLFIYSCNHVECA